MIFSELFVFWLFVLLLLLIHNTVMNKSIQGGTVPALIWKDVMKVATEPYGKAEFNYPQIELMPFAAGSNVKIIGEQNKPKEENNSPEQDNLTPEVVEPKLPESVKKIEQTKPVTPQAQTPKPTAKPVQVKETTAPVPIPMAVPENLH